MTDISSRERLVMLAEAQARLDSAVEALTTATQLLAQALPAQHDTLVSADLANEKARVARAKLVTTMRRIPWEGRR